MGGGEEPMIDGLQSVGFGLPNKPGSRKACRLLPFEERLMPSSMIISLVLRREWGNGSWGLLLGFK